jgi:hypothetical protein
MHGGGRLPYSDEGLPNVSNSDAEESSQAHSFYPSYATEGCVMPIDLRDVQRATTPKAFLYRLVFRSL